MEHYEFVKQYVDLMTLMKEIQNECEELEGLYKEFDDYIIELMPIIFGKLSYKKQVIFKKESFELIAGDGLRTGRTYTSKSKLICPADLQVLKSYDAKIVSWFKKHNPDKLSRWTDFRDAVMPYYTAMESFNGLSQKDFQIIAKKKVSQDIEVYEEETFSKVSFPLVSFNVIAEYGNIELWAVSSMKWDDKWSEKLDGYKDDTIVGIKFEQDSLIMASGFAEHFSDLIALLKVAQATIRTDAIGVLKARKEMKDKLLKYTALVDL